MAFASALAAALPWVQTGIDAVNSWFSWDQNQYQRRMQREAWNREDNAVSRRVADLKRAGLSPVLAAGSAASSSSPINIGPPRVESSGLDAAATLAGMRRTEKEVEVLESQKEKNAADTDLAHTSKVAQLAKVAESFQGIEESKTRQKEAESRTLNNEVERLLKAFDLESKTYDFNIAKGMKVRYQGGGSLGKEIADAVNVTMEALNGGNVPGHVAGGVIDFLSKLVKGEFNPKIEVKQPRIGFGNFRQLEGR